jgi:hypothetical protein
MVRYTNRHVREARLGIAVLAAALFMTDIASSYAGEVATIFAPSGIAVPAGSAAMLEFRLPLGGNRSPDSQPAFSFAFGSTWQDAPGSFALKGYRFVPSVEAG